MLCINTFGRVIYFPDQAKKKIQNGRTSTLNRQKSSFILQTPVTQKRLGLIFLLHSNQKRSIFCSFKRIDG